MTQRRASHSRTAISWLVATLLVLSLFVIGAIDSVGANDAASSESPHALANETGVPFGDTSIVLRMGYGAGAERPANFRAHLSGADEVPPVETDARGQAIFQKTEGGLSFKLIVANIENVTAAHIHCAPEGVNGPVGVTLFMSSPPTGRVNGILNSDTITAPDEGNGCGWSDLDAVIAAMVAGDTYVNVHTTDNPGGEIRGQIR